VNFAVKWLVNIAALFIVIHIVAGVSADNWQAIIVAAFVLGLFNAFLRPFVIALTLPINILSFGLFTLIINAGFFYLAAKFVKGFSVMGFWNAFWASIVFSIISFVLNIMLSGPAGSGFSFRTNLYRQPEPPKRYKDAIDVEATVVDKKQTDQGGTE
jgi:putative membrane protein